MFNKLKSTSTLWLISIIALSIFCYFNKDFNFSKITEVFDVVNYGSSILMMSIPMVVTAYIVYSVFIRLRKSKREYDAWIEENKNNNRDGE